MFLLSYSFFFWFLFFFFKQKTAYELRISDWSSDVCSSDLAFETVGRIEQVLAAGLALPAGQCAQAVEAPRDRADEAPLAFAIGGHRAEHRRARLVGPVRAPQPLDRGRGLPARLEQEMDAAPGRAAAAEVGMIGPSRAARIGEGEDRLSTRHEIVAVGLASAEHARFELLVAARVKHDTPRTPGHLGDLFAAEVGDQRIERGRDRRHTAELLDQRIARRQRFLAMDRRAVLTNHHLGAHRAVARPEGAQLPGRESILEVINEGLNRRYLKHEVRR